MCSSDLSFGNDIINGGDGSDSLIYAWLDGSSILNGITVDLSGDDDFVTGVDEDLNQVFRDDLTDIEGFWGTVSDDTFIGDNNANGFAGGYGGSDTFTGGLGDDGFRFTDSENVDKVTDFRGASGTENDILRFDESFGLEFNAHGTDEYINASTNDATKINTMDYQIIGVTDVISDLSDMTTVASVFDNAVNAAGNGTDDGTYFVGSDGDGSNAVDHSKVFYWEGDINENSAIDADELKHFVDLEGFTNIASLTTDHFEIT